MKSRIYRVYVKKFTSKLPAKLNNDAIFVKTLYYASLGLFKLTAAFSLVYKWPYCVFVLRPVPMHSGK